MISVITLMSLARVRYCAQSTLARGIRASAQAGAPAMPIAPLPTLRLRFVRGASSTTCWNGLFFCSWNAALMLPFLALSSMNPFASSHWAMVTSGNVDCTAAEVGGAGVCARRRE